MNLKHLFWGIFASIFFSSIYLEESRSQYLVNEISEPKNILNNLQKDFYLLGPGDLLTMKIYSTDELSGDYKILSDGHVILPLIGSIYVNNLTIDQAILKIKKKYSDELIDPEMYLFVKEQRPIRVSILGEVMKPGNYQLKDPRTNENFNPNYASTLVDLIQLAGGITKETNLKNVSLIRRIPGNNGEVLRKKTTLNLISLLIEGDYTQNPVLLDGDALIFEKSKSSSIQSLDIYKTNLAPDHINVTIVGEVKDPGLVKLKSNTPLVQAIYHAGGPVAWKANTNKVEHVRVNQDGTIKRNIYKINLSKKVSDESNPKLDDGDIILVNSTNISKNLNSIVEITKPISGVVNAITLFKLLGD